MSLDYQSIIRTIASSISANNAAKVRIEERSKLFMGLATAPDDGDSADENPQREQNRADNKEFWRFGGMKFNQDSRLPVTRFLWRGFVVVCRFLYAAIAYGVVGFIPLVLKLCGMKDVKYVPTYLSRSRRYNFFLFVVMVVGFVLLLVSLGAYFMRDVIMFPKNGYSNQSGAVVMEQPFASTHYLYLFNSAIPWSNTGIEVLKGDEITISASGGFSNDIAEQKLSAERNMKKPDFQYINPGYKLREDNYNAPELLKKIRLYPDAFTNGEKSRYGSLLYSIAPETGGGVDDTLTRIYQLDVVNGRNPIIADRDGVLRVSINDIYFSEAVVDTLIHGLKSDMNSLSRDSVISKLNKSLPEVAWIDNAIANVGGARNSLKNHPSIWFDDNNGEILLNIKVRRNPWMQSDKTMPDKIYGGIFGGIDSLPEKAMSGAYNWFWLGIVVFLLADFALGYYLRRQKKALQN